MKGKNSSIFQKPLLRLWCKQWPIIIFFSSGRDNFHETNCWHVLYVTLKLLMGKRSFCGMKLSKFQNKTILIETNIKLTPSINNESYWDYYKSVSNAPRLQLNLTATKWQSSSHVTVRLWVSFSIVYVNFSFCIKLNQNVGRPKLVYLLEQTNLTHCISLL